ncbi:hypothetical protein RND81_09G155300 [Saponaria officinalis]|uniref:Uncharacterized protein n=1 Tax=Saponaria officinalis TaxID=3572 RepID=A0AAW1ILX1_SAPOF
MATTMSSAWAKPGAWALDSELHEDELSAPPPPAADFPSLSAASTTKPKKKTKKVLSLAEFSTYTPPSSSSAAAVDVVLPTGPRERTAEEIAESRRGGFRNYGGDRPRVSRDGYDGDSSRGRDMGPSRADENDDWGKSKKFSSFGPGSGSGPDRERDMGPSRADEVDDWSKGKKLGGGFGSERGDRREKMGFFNSSRADDVDNWAANKSPGLGPVDDRRRERRGGFEPTGPRPDVDNWVKGKESGSASGRPRLNLQPRTLPVESIKVNNDNVNAVGGGDGGGEVAVAKANPFGAARPREEVLKEKGKDWKEIDEKLEALKMKEVERSGGGERRGFGFGRSDGVDERSVGAWRRPGLLSHANVVANAAPPRFDPCE